MSDPENPPQAPWLREPRPGDVILVVGKDAYDNLSAHAQRAVAVAAQALADEYRNQQGHRDEPVKMCPALYPPIGHHCDWVVVWGPNE